MSNTNQLADSIIRRTHEARWEVRVYRTGSYLDVADSGDWNANFSTRKRCRQFVAGILAEGGHIEGESLHLAPYAGVVD